MRMLRSKNPVRRMIGGVWAALAALGTSGSNLKSVAAPTDASPAPNGGNGIRRAAADNSGSNSAAGHLAFRVLCGILLFVPLQVAVALTNDLALTPPMGWNDWYAFKCNITESAVEAAAAAMEASGMKAAGYQYVNIDDCWQAARDSDGVIVADPTRFPDGIQSLAEFLHADGFKLGVYTSHGRTTCKGKPGSYGYEYLDAFTYADWGVDFLKDDACGLPAGDNPQADYFRMSDGLMKSGRPVVFSLCEASYGYEYWAPVLGNLWRTTGDTSATWSSVISHIDPNSRSAYLAGPGRWNDPDILQVGLGDFTNLVPAQTHFTMWCIMAAPLLAGNDVTSMSAQTLSILTNAEAIAVDQDPAGEQGVWAGGIQDAAEVWSKPLGYDFTTRAVALLNRSTTTPASITCVWTNLGLQSGAATVRDLWAHADLGTFTNSFTTNVPPKGVVFLKIVGTPVPPPAPGTNYLSDLKPVYAYVDSNNVWVAAARDKSIGGHTLTLDSGAYSKGLGATSTSGLEYNLGGRALRFQSDIGLDDEVGGSGSVIFQVFADGTEIYDSGIMTGGTAKKSVDLDVTGVRRLTLGVTDTINNLTGNRSTVSTTNHADWANALVIATNTPQMPERPTGLAASPGNAITLNWNPTLAAITYNVKRATVSGGPYTTIASVPISSFTDSTVVSGTNYYYVVSAVSSLGEGSNSVEAGAAPCSVPSPPTSVVAAGSNGFVAVSWNASAGATSYNVYRFTAATPPVLIGPGITTTNFTDTSASPVVTNYYLVTAANACNQSGWSVFAGVVTPLGAPTGLTAFPGDSQVGLSWTAPPGGTAFNVKRAITNGGPYTTIATNISGTGYLDTAVVNGTTYYYVVSALGAGGEGPNSEQVSATPFVNTNPPQITRDLPPQVTVVSGRSCIYSIGVTGPMPCFYQWYNAGTAIVGATNAAYTAAAGSPGSTSYYVVITNLFGAATSTVSVFTSIGVPPPPATAYATNILQLNPAGYWPMHEVESAAPGDVEVNYGSLGVLGTAYYPDWAQNSGAFVRGWPGALVSDTDPAVHFTKLISSSPGQGTWTNELYIPHASPLVTLNPPFSVECWFYPTNSGGGSSAQSVWGQHGFEALNAGSAGSGNGPYKGIQLSYNGGFQVYVYANGVQIATASSSSAAINQWHHLVATCDANTNITLYLDGTAGSTVAAAGKYMPDYWTPLTIGGTRGGTRSCAGSIDEFAVYTNVISDVSTHYYDALAAASGQYFNDVRKDNPLIYLRMDAPPYTPPPLNTWPVLFNYGRAGSNGLYTPGTVPGTVPGPSQSSGSPIRGLPGASVPFFSGVSSFAVAGYAAAFDPTGSNANFSVTAMFRGNPCDNRVQTIVGHGTHSWQLCVTTNGCIVFNAGNGNSAAGGGTGQDPGDISTRGVYNDGNWHQVVAVNQTNVVSIYVDGALDTTGTPAGVTPTNIIPGNSSDVLIGADPSCTNNPAGVGRQFAGQVCEVALFTNALTAAQIQTIYQIATTPIPELLTFTNSGPGQLQLNWTYGTLQSATNVAGPYADFTNASPPFVVPMTNAQQFYRVKENQTR